MFCPDDCYEKLLRLTPHKKFLIAYSGGVDSHTLLHCLVMVRKKNPELQLRAIHINHGLSPNAVMWQEHCQAICRDMQVELLIKTIDVNPLQGESLEALARELRYQVLENALLEDETLLTGHTQNDQAETLLLQLMRGAGIKGMAAMPGVKIFSRGFLARPLLSFTREELLHYAKAQQLKWIEDESNINLRFERNFLRQQIIPQLRTRWPALEANLVRAAEHCAETSHLLDELAAQDFIAAKINDLQLSCVALLLLSPARQRNVLRYWFRQINIKLPSRKKLMHIQTDLLSSRHDATPMVHWGDVTLRRYRQCLYLLSKEVAHDPSIIIPWNLQQSLTLPNSLGTLVVNTVGDLRLRINLDAENITVRFRCGGEILQIAGRKGTHDLKKLFQEWGIPPWQRSRIPLIYENEKLIAIVGYAVDASYQSHGNGLVISLHENF